MKHEKNFYSSKFAKKMLNAQSSSLQIVDLETFSPSAQGYDITLALSSSSRLAARPAGDFNGDNVPDIIVSVVDNGINNNIDDRQINVVYGKTSGYNNTIDLANSNSSVKTTILGGNRFGSLGDIISSIDFNNDGLSDIIVPRGSWIYVIYGKVGGYANDVDTDSFTSGSDGFIIKCIEGIDAANNAGDINNDGIDDLIIGMDNARPLGRNNAGIVNILYGRNGGYSNDVEMENITASQGFSVFGANQSDLLGNSANRAGDVNNDGIGDIIISAPSAVPLGRTAAGIAYVIYGRNGGYTDPIDLANFSPTQGFSILGAGFSSLGRDLLGSKGNSVSWAGDFNNDGIDDVIVGAGNASPNTSPTRPNGGIAYIVYGANGGYVNPVDVVSPIDGQILTIIGTSQLDRLGDSVGPLLDIDGGGFDCLGIGAPNADPVGRSNAGIAYSFCGPASKYGSIIDTATLTQGTTFQGPSGQARVAGDITTVGDINNDGINDFTITGGQRVYVIYGKQPDPSASSSFSPSVSPSETPSASSSVSPSLSTSVNGTPSASSSVSPGLSTSVNETPSVSSSVSLGLSTSVNGTPSASSSVSPGLSTSVNETPSASSSVSPRLSVTTSPLSSESITPSNSISAISNLVSMSQSPSKILSVSTAKSLSVSHSKTPSTTFVQDSSSITPSTVSASISTSTLENLSSNYLVNSNLVSETDTTNRLNTESDSSSTRSFSDTDSDTTDRSSSTNSDTISEESRLFQIESDSISSGSKLQPWFSPMRVIKGIMKFWQTNSVDNITSNPQACKLVALQEKAIKLKDNSDHIEDDWYRVFLEDLIYDISTDLRNAQLITSETVKEYKLSLSCLYKDFSVVQSKENLLEGFFQGIEQFSDLSGDVQELNSVALVDGLFKLTGESNYLMLDQ